MFGDNDQSDNKTADSGQKDAPVSPAVSKVSSFNMDSPGSSSQTQPEPTSAPTTNNNEPSSTQPLVGDHPGAGFKTTKFGDAPEPKDTQNDNSSPADDGLLDIKQQALGQLSPIVNHLDQSPEEKFKTLMMMIQASDNKDLIKEAYEAAQQIPDEKAKAQALLDVVNEINYFTQNNS